MGNIFKSLGNIAKGIINPIGTAIDAVGGIFGNLYNANQARKAEARQFQMQKDLMAYQNDMNHQNWLEQTEYNSPANQMKRLQEAGLNPNLVYGHGADAQASPISSVSGGSAHANVPRFDNISISQPLAQYAQTQNTIKQNQYIQAQTDYTKAKARNEILNSIGIGHKNSILGYQSDYAGRTLAGRILSIDLDNNLKQKEYEYKENLIAESNSRIAVNNANIGLIEQKTGFTKEQSRYVNSQIEYLSTKMLLNHAELSRMTQLTPLMVEELQNRVTLLADDHDIKELYKGNDGLIRYKIRLAMSQIEKTNSDTARQNQETINARVIPYAQLGLQGVRTTGDILKGIIGISRYVRKF